jgi:predicted transcriptional regulator
MGRKRKEGANGQGKRMMKINDAETIILLHFEILYILKRNGPLSTNDVATNLHVDRRKARKCLRLLTRKRFLRSSDQDGSTKYRLVLMGNILLDNLNTLMNEGKSAPTVENLKSGPL